MQQTIIIKKIKKLMLNNKVKAHLLLLMHLLPNVAFILCINSIKRTYEEGNSNSKNNIR